MRPLGERQLQLLILCSSVTGILLTPDKASDSLVRRGLLEQHGKGGQAITAAGLRRLADEMDAGRVVPALKRIKAQVAERRGAARARAERRAQS